MALEDIMEPEVAVAVAVTAAVSSPRARRVMRQGAVYGLAGILKAGDAVSTFAQGVGRGVQEVAEDAKSTVEGEAEQAPHRPNRARASKASREAEGAEA